MPLIAAAVRSSGPCGASSPMGSTSSSSSSSSLSPRRTQNGVATNSVVKIMPTYAAQRKFASPSPTKLERSPGYLYSFLPHRSLRHCFGHRSRSLGGGSVVLAVGSCGKDGGGDSCPDPTLSQIRRYCTAGVMCEHHIDVFGRKLRSGVAISLGRTTRLNSVLRNSR